MNYEHPFSIYTENGQVKNGHESMELQLPPTERFHTIRFLTIHLL